MNEYGFEVAHGYQIFKGIVNAENEEQAIQKIENKKWGDIIEEFDCDVFTEGYKVVDIWTYEAI